MHLQELSICHRLAGSHIKREALEQGECPQLFKGVHVALVEVQASQHRALAPRRNVRDIVISVRSRIKGSMKLQDLQGACSQKISNSRLHQLIANIICFPSRYFMICNL